MLTKEGQVYFVGGVAILGLVLVLWLGSLLWWIIGGVTLLYGVYQGARLWGKAHAGLTEAQLRKARVDKARAEAALKREEVEAARARRHLIPEGYIGAQLTAPTQASLYHVWPQPSTINYNGLEPGVVEALPALPLPAVHFRDIAHQIGVGQMLIGVREDGSLRLGTWDDHKTILVLGKSSSGKTTTIAEKAGEAVKSGACLVVCDPHAAKADSLARKLEPLQPFLLPGTGIVSRHEDVLSCIHLVARELELRVSGAPCDPAIVLIVEELNRLMRDERLAEDIATITQAIGQEGRGFGIYAVFGAQDMIGPALAKLRRSFISYIIHRTDEAQAKLLIPSRYARTAPELPAGHTYVVDDDGVTEPLRQALITAADLEELARHVPRRQPAYVPPMAPLASILKPGYSEAEVLRVARAAQEEMERVCVQEPETEKEVSDPKITVLHPHTHTLTHKAARVTPEQRQFILEKTAAGKSPSAIAILLWNDAHKNVIVRQVLEEAAEQEADA